MQFLFPFWAGDVSSRQGTLLLRSQPRWGGAGTVSKPPRVGAFLGQNVHRALQPAGGSQLQCPSASSSCWRKALGQGDVGAWRGAGTAQDWPHPHSLLLQGTCTAWQRASWHSIQPGHRPAAALLCQKCGTGQDKLHGVSLTECQDRRGGRTELGMSHGGHTGQQCRAGAPHRGITTRLRRPGRGTRTARGVGVCVANAGSASLVEPCTRWCETPQDTHGVRGRLWVRRVPGLCVSTPSCSAAVSTRRRGSFQAAGGWGGSI